MFYYVSNLQQNYVCLYFHRWIWYGILFYWNSEMVCDKVIVFAWLFVSQVIFFLEEIVWLEGVNFFAHMED